MKHKNYILLKYLSAVEQSKWLFIILGVLTATLFVFSLDQVVLQAQNGENVSYELLRASVELFTAIVSCMLAGVARKIDDKHRRFV